MEPVENHILKEFNENVTAVNKVLSIFTAKDYRVMIKNPDIIFNDEVKKLMEEKISNIDQVVSLDETRVIFSGELDRIDFVFKVVKKHSYQRQFAGTATNYFLANILGIPEKFIKVFRLFLKNEPDEGTFILSLNKYASVVHESVPSSCKP